VVVQPHELFERHDDDILYQVDLTMVQAALGTTISVPTLDGDEDMEFEPGTQPGEVKVLRGKGVKHLNGHGRGDQQVLVRVLVPYELEEEQRQLLKDFESCCGPEHYEDRPEGVLSKLRGIFR
jgi:molecular chaperone DnaJ